MHTIEPAQSPISAVANSGRIAWLELVASLRMMTAVSGARVVSGDVARAILLADGQLQVSDGPVDVESRVIKDRDHLERADVPT